MKTYILIFLTLFLTDYSIADTWSLPEMHDYCNSDSTYFVRIYPMKYSDKYSGWLNASPRKKRKFHPADTLITPCYAQMFKVEKGNDSLIWEKKLINRVAPASAIVSDNGKYIVTFDNWGSTGYGVDVMAFYNHKGELIKRFMLEDISPFPINSYLMSVSSIWWRCGQKFIDNERISICFLAENEKMVERTYNLTAQKFEEDAP